MTKDFQFAAKRLVNDETAKGARDVILGVLVKQLLSATTPEDREQKFQEYKSLERIWGFLEKQAVEADKD